MRILILSASVGSGHLRAAEAVELALKELAPGAVVKNVDVLQLTNSAFRKIYGDGYLKLANQSPHLLGYLYDSLNQVSGYSGRMLESLRLATQRINFRAMSRLLEDEPWDVVVNTHFLPAEIVAYLRRAGRLKSPQATVVTDFDAHRIWVHPPCEQYAVASEDAAGFLRGSGVPANSIRLTGIPVHPSFSLTQDRDRCRKLHSIKGDRPVVLQLSGGSGVGPVEQTFVGLLACEEPLDIIAVSGKNEEARKRLLSMPLPERHRARILGYTNKIHELMVAADLLVTKPGGLTVSEALALGTPIVIVDPIPGQETRNSDFLLENGAAVKINSLAGLPQKIGGLFRDSQKLKALRKNAKRLGKPKAAFEVAQMCLDLARHSQISCKSS